MAAPQQFTSQGAAAQALQAQIAAAINKIPFPPGLGAPNNEITRGIIQNIDANAFDKHNQMGIIEVHANFTATRGNGTTVFNLEVIWDADNPPVGAIQTAHYGYEIYLDGQRIVGPEHIWFATNIILSHYRNTQMIQVEDTSLKISKSGVIGTGRMSSQTRYFKLQ